MNKKLKVVLLGLYMVYGSLNSTKPADSDKVVAFPSLGGETLSGAPQFTVDGDDYAKLTSGNSDSMNAVIASNLQSIYRSEPYRYLVPPQTQIEESGSKITVPCVRTKAAEFLYTRERLGDATNSYRETNRTYLTLASPEELGDRFGRSYIYPNMTDFDMLADLEPGYYTVRELTDLLPELNNHDFNVRIGTLYSQAKLTDFDSVVARSFGLNLLDTSLLCMDPANGCFRANRYDSHNYSLSVHRSRNGYQVDYPNMEFQFRSEHPLEEWYENRGSYEYSWDFINKLPSEVFLTQLKFLNHAYDFEADLRPKLSNEAISLIQWIISKHYRHERQSKLPSQIFQSFDLRAIFAMLKTQVREEIAIELGHQPERVENSDLAIRQFEEAFAAQRASEAVE